MKTGPTTPSEAVRQPETPTGSVRLKKISLFALLVLANGSISVAQDTNNLRMGMSRTDVIAIEGQPKGSFLRENGELLLFENGTVTLHNGKVTAIELLTPEQYEKQRKLKEEARLQQETAGKSPERPPSQQATPPDRPPGSVTGDEGDWETDFAQASADAARSQRCMLLDFTGSDWCGWCKKLNNEVFNQNDFKTFAAQKLICVQLDFPRKKEQTGKLKEQNRELAKKYSVRGYPTVVLLSPNGDLVSQQIGYLGGPQKYLEWLRTTIAAFEQKQAR
jgi:thioredoxin-related protein